MSSNRKLAIEVEWFIEHLTSSVNWIAKAYNVYKKGVNYNNKNTCIITIWILQLRKLTMNC